MTELIARLLQAEKNFRQLTNTGLPDLLREAAEALRAAQERGEAVAWMTADGFVTTDRAILDTGLGVTPLYAAPVAAAGMVSLSEIHEWLLSDLPGDTVEEREHRQWLSTQLLQRYGGNAARPLAPAPAAPVDEQTEREAFEAWRESEGIMPLIGHREWLGTLLFDCWQAARAQRRGE